MKKTFLLFLFASASALAQDQVKFAAKVQNRNSDTLHIQSRTLNKVLVSDANGNFKDAFAVQPGFYQMFDGSEVATIYLKNGYDLAMTMNAKMFDETISFKGTGEKENNYIAKKFMDIEAMEAKLATAKDNAATTKIVDETFKKLESGLADTSLDENFRTIMTKQLTSEKAEIIETAAKMQKMHAMKGKPSPQFAYENHKGGTTKLADLKGKYVYIDVWATWCGPCRQQIPFLQKIEEDYHGKKIEFVSVSIDTKKDYEKWRKMVTDKSLGGIQLIADKDWSSEFTKAYGIDSIPRFILIDPKGNVVDADAARPSDPALRAQLDKLLK